jgi:hypothetical protein
MTLPPPEICQRIRNLHAMIGSPYDNEANGAREQLNKLLVKEGVTWNDLPEILAVADINTSTGTSTGASQAPMDVPAVNVLDLTLRLIELHIAITPAERMAAALWVLHTYLFDHFKISPRLALLSPLRGCGKTRLMVLMKLLVNKPNYSDNVTPAVIYRELELRPGTTFLLDEADNQGLLNDRVLRSVFNSGHGREGSIDRIVDGLADRALSRGQDRKAGKDPARALTLRSIRVEFEKFSLASFFAQQGWQIWTGNTRVVFLRERVSVPGNKASASPSLKEIFNLDTWISQQAAILAYALASVLG